MEAILLNLAKGWGFEFEQCLVVPHTLEAVASSFICFLQCLLQRLAFASLLRYGHGFLEVFSFWGVLKSKQNHGIWIGSWQWQVYVVYMGNKSGQDPDDILNHNHQMLASVHSGR